jgi:hypothetical protein
VSQRTLHEHVRQAFAALTRPPRPQLGDRVRDSLWERPAPAAPARPEPGALVTRTRPARPTAPARPPAALLSFAGGMLLVALVSGLLLFGGAGHQLGRLAGLLPRPAAAWPAGTPTPARASRPSPSPSVSPSPSASPSPAATPTSAPTDTPPPPPTAPPVAALPGFACGPQTGGGAGPAAMTTARVGAQNGFDRFVIQFSSGVPQFEVRPQDGASFGQGGAAVALQGSSGLAVVLHDTSGSGSYAGPSDLRPGYSSIREVRLVSDSQGTVEWGVGLSHATCFHAWTLGGPSRLVIDVQD